MKNNRIALYIDLLFCLVFMPLVIMLLPVDRWLVDNAPFLFTLILYVYALYFVYRRAHLTKLCLQKRYLPALFILLVLFTVTHLFTHFPLPEGFLGADEHRTAAWLNNRRRTIWFFFLVVTGFSLAIELTFELFRQKLSVQEMKAEKDKAELALYKAQINPHFLFNTLNALYALVLSGSEKTESAFVKFSNILRYMYTQIHTETIPVGLEIEYIRQYVELQQLRLNRHTQVHFLAEADDEQTPVPPMILITFVENAFKYGISSEVDCTISIRIRINGGELDFQTENSILRIPRGDHPPVGIANCRKRLSLLYPGRFHLSNGAEGNIYKTHLTIRLK